MEKTEETTARFGGSLPQKIALGAALLIVVFLIGYVPSCVSARSAQQQRAQLESRLRLSDLRGRLGMASYEANRNNYANAMQFSTEFYTGLRDLIEDTEDQTAKKKMQDMMTRRDEITTNLAQADPAVKEKLSAMYAEFYQLSAEKADKQQ